MKYFGGGGGVCVGVLWPRMWSVLVNVSCRHQKNVCSAVASWSIL